MSKHNHALIIGASSGYGMGIASALRDAGYQVITAQRRPCPVPGIKSIHLDVCDESQVSAVAHQLSDFDFQTIVYCAGIAAPIVPQSEKTVEQIEQVVKTNSFGLIYCVKHFVDMIAYGGVFCYIGSISETRNYYGGAEYCASKAFAASYIRAMRLEYLSSGVRFCNVAPGMGDTEFHSHRGLRSDAIGGRIRKLSIEAVGKAVVFVASQPDDVCISHLTITPTDQAEHGYDINNLP